MVLASSALALALDTFENTAVVRTVELGGALVHVTTTYAVKALQDGSREYVVSMGETEQERTSWLEARIKGESDALVVKSHGVQEYVCSSFDVSVHSIDKNAQRHISVCGRVAKRTVDGRIDQSCRRDCTDACYLSLACSGCAIR